MLSVLGTGSRVDGRKLRGGTSWRSVRGLLILRNWRERRVGGGGDGVGRIDKLGPTCRGANASGSAVVAQPCW